MRLVPTPLTYKHKHHTEKRLSPGIGSAPSERPIHWGHDHLREKSNCYYLAAAGKGDLAHPRVLFELHGITPYTRRRVLLEG